jgi:hypothetical protein
MIQLNLSKELPLAFVIVPSCDIRGNWQSCNPARVGRNDTVMAATRHSLCSPQLRQSVHFKTNAEASKQHYCVALSGAQDLLISYPPFRLRVRSPSGWAKLSSRLTALHFRSQCSAVALSLSNGVELGAFQDFVLKKLFKIDWF